MSKTASAGLRYFSKIQTVEQAEQAIKEVAYVLYAIAALQALLGFFIYPRLASWTFDVAFAVVMGFILQKSKSRCVALVVAAYATIVALLTVAIGLGLYGGEGGKNIVLAAIVAYTAYRGVYATVRLHRWRNTKADRKNVAILTVIAVVLTAVVVLATIVIAVVLGYDLHRDTDTDTVGFALFFAVWMVWLLVFDRLLPVIRRLQVVKLDAAALSSSSAAQKKTLP
jgi:multisubunit Na+/H+ antiporter MnhC subunit